MLSACRWLGEFLPFMVRSAAIGDPIAQRAIPGARGKARRALGDDATGSRLLREDVELRNLLLPMIRADYQVIETYESPVGSRLRAPVLVLRGDADEEASAEDAAAWPERTYAKSSMSGP